MVIVFTGDAYFEECPMPFYKLIENTILDAVD